jgi:hypothetical protein
MVLRILLLLFIAIFITYYVGCKSPEEYDPYDDSLIDPPEPPEPLVPAESASYVWTPQVGPVYHLDFEWSEVIGAQNYELEIAVNQFFEDADIYITSQKSIEAELHYIATYYWHVRAWSSAWTYYTEWSDKRTFRIIHP